MKKHFAIATMLLSFTLTSLPVTLEAAPKKAGTSATKKAKKFKKKKSGGSADYSAMNFMPFGIGQFTQGRPITGVVIGGGQVGMLGAFMYMSSQVTAANKEAKDVIAEIGTGTPDAKTQKYIDDNAKYVKDTNTMKNLALVGFFGVWALGVVDAVWDPLGMRRGSSTADIDEMDDNAQKWAAETRLHNVSDRTRFSMFAAPKEYTSTGTFGLSFEKPIR